MEKRDLKNLMRSLELHGYKKSPYFNSETSFVFEKYLVKESTYSLRMRWQTWDHSEIRMRDSCSAEATAIIGCKGIYDIHVEIKTREDFDIEKIEAYADRILNNFKREILSSKEVEL